MEIREARIDDLERLTDLWEEFMDFHKECDLFLKRRQDGRERWAEYAKENIESEDWLFLVAVVDGQAVGHAMATVKDNPPVFETKHHGYIQDFVVAASHRRQGIGRQLYQRIEAWFRQQGIDRLEVTAATTNEVSRSFWRKMGYRDYVERLAKPI